MAMSITGVVSGIDWDSMVTELIENAQKPALVVLEKRDKLELKKTLWEELQVSFQSLQSALSSLKLASTFTAKDIEIERIDRNTSYKGVLTATVNADAAINVYDLEVLNLATKQIMRSDTFTTVGSDTYFYVNAGGQNVRIDVASSDTPESLVDKINTQLKTQVPPVAVTAAVVDSKLILSSDSTGLGQTTHTATLTRSLNAYDSLLFTSDSITDGYTLDIDLNGVNGGTLTVKGEDGTVYKISEDFDIVGGNRIRWRSQDPLTPPPGAVYQDTYTAYAGDTFTVKATRASDSNTDVSVLPFAPHSGATVTITDETGNTYVHGTDFQVLSTGYVEWLEGGSKPSDGNEYEVSYTAAGGETVTLEITRGNQDTLTSLSYADFTGGTATIQQAGSRIWREGLDFEIVQGANGEAVVQWYPGGAGDFPKPGSDYTVTLQKADGTVVTEAGVQRSVKDTVNLPNNGTFTTSPQGTHVITYNGVDYPYPFSPSADPDETNPWSFEPTLDSTGQGLEIRWKEPTNPDSPTTRSTIPSYGNTSNDTYTVTYTYNSNTFYLSDDGNGALATLGLDNMDEDHYTAAQDATLRLDGELVTRSSNVIGENYGNELIKGMTLQLKGVGQVSLDVSQDAEAAVTALQDFITEYNDVLNWVNVRITEEALDATTAETVESDDYRLKWGLLRGNSILRGIKDSLRRLTSQIYSASFAQRSSRDAIYGTMLQNGLANEGFFTVTVGTRVATIPVTSDDTLNTIAAKINSSKIGGQNNPLYFDSDGEAYSVPLAKAVVEGNKLTIQSGTESNVTLGGSTSVLSSLGLNYKYSALSQIGIKLSSTGEMSDQGKAGELDFDTSVFMAALEDSPQDVSTLVTHFAEQMQTYVDNMIKSSTKEVAAGVTTAQGAVIREMNAIDTEIQSIDSYLDKFEQRLLARQESLQAKFAAAEVSLSTMMQQASWLESITAQLQSNASTS